MKRIDYLVLTGLLSLAQATFAAEVPTLFRSVNIFDGKNEKRA